MNKITAVIVARKGSKRIPNKNYQKIGDDNLIERKIKQLKKSKYINEIILGTDDDDLRDLADKLEINFVRRPDEYCDEISRTPNDMITNMLSFFESEYVIWCHPTNPLISGEIYDDAIEKFFEAKKQSDKIDSLFSAIEQQGHFWIKHDNQIEALNFDPNAKVHKTARELPAIYSQNGGIFIRDYVNMSKDGNFLGKHPYMYAMNSVKGIDIDYPIDLEVARLFDKI